MNRYGKRNFGQIFDLGGPTSYEPDYEDMIRDAQARGAPNSVSQQYHAAQDPMAQIKEGKKGRSVPKPFSQLREL